MRNFEDILRDKLYEASNDYSDSVWGNIKGQIPIKKKNNSHLFWMVSFLIVFAMMITMVQQYPSWKVQMPESNKKTAALDINDFINNPEDRTTRQYSSLGVDLSKPLEIDSKNNKAQILDVSVVSKSDFTVDKATLNWETQTKNNTKGIAQENAIPFSFADGSDQLELNSDHRIAIIPLQNLKLNSYLNTSFNLPVIDQLNVGRRFKGNDVHCEVLKGKQSKYYVSARHISSYAFNNMRAKNLEAEEYMNSRHVTESKRYSYSDEVTFGMEYRSGFFAELGIRYDQINEKFNYLDPNAYQSSTVITIDTIFAGDNPEILVDTVTTILAGEREILSNNKFRKLSIPFSVGYQYPLNKKVSLAAKAGIVVNVLSNYEGRMFDEELNVTSIQDRQASKDPFYNKLVHSFSGSAFLQYHVNRNMEFLVGVNAYKNLGSTSFETNPIDQKYSSLGIFVGGKYNL